MRDRESMLRTLLMAGAIFAFTAPASAAGMGGASVGGIGIGVPGAGGGGLAGVSGAIGGAVGGVAGAANSAAGGSGLSAVHAVGAGDGPSGLSASSGHNPFGNVKPSTAWTSLPALDPSMPGVTAPSVPSLPSGAPSLPALASLPSAPALPGLGKGAPSAPSVDVKAKADIAGHSESVNINTASLGKSGPTAPGLPSGSTASPTKATKSAGAPHLGKSAKAPRTANLTKSAKLPKTASLTKSADLPSSKSPSLLSSKQTKALSKAGIPTSAQQEEANLGGPVSLASSTVGSEVTSTEHSSATPGKAPKIPSMQSIHQTAGHEELVAGVLGGLVAHETQGYINQQVGPITGGTPGSAIPSDPVNVGPHNAAP